MALRPFLLSIFLTLSFFCLLLSGQEASGQITIRGTVYNMYRTKPLDAVSVLSTSGRGAVTDSNGYYMLVVNQKDSISFSYLGRTTVKFPVSTINTASNFDIALHVDPTELRPVRIAPRNYRADSIRNRQDYAKVFDFNKPGLSLTSPSSGLGVGLDLDELINVFRFRRTRRMLAFQRRLVDEEHDKFIDHRFNRSIVKKISHLDGNDLDSFLVSYRPSYEFTISTTDYEFYDYIKLAAREYGQNKKKGGELKKEEK
ncbi:MAG TPA: carboxypeptidase-like regulatory domain-containing protein [Puia sp.]|nr:carboxypeptidase-like regulatory domain-containing protein [Puia sp.]